MAGLNWPEVRVKYGVAASIREERSLTTEDRELCGHTLL